MARYDDLRIEKLDGCLSLSWTRDDQRWRGDDELAGDVILRTSRNELSGPEVWSLEADYT